MISGGAVHSSNLNSCWIAIQFFSQLIYTLMHHLNENYFPLGHLRLFGIIGAILLKSVILQIRGGVFLDDLYSSGA